LLEAGAHAIRGEHTQSIETLQIAIERFERAKMSLHAASARYALSSLLRAEQAAELRQRAIDALEDERVADPARLANSYAPGFDVR
jgi:predicted HTH domain antitoxin